jgi:hypothetical protein
MEPPNPILKPFLWIFEIFDFSHFHKKNEKPIWLKTKFDSFPLHTIKLPKKKKCNWFVGVAY